MAAWSVQVCIRVRGAWSRVRAGDGRVLSEVLHTWSLPLVGDQILYFLTEKLLNSLSDRQRDRQVFRLFEIFEKKIKINSEVTAAYC